MLVAETVLLVAGHPDLPPAVVPGYVLAVGLVIALRQRWPLAAFAGALLLNALTGTSYLLLSWAAYQVGRAGLSRRDGALLGCGTVVALASQLGSAPGPLPEAGGPLVVTYLVFVALPVLTGRYLSQQEQLVSTLQRHNRQLRRERELLAEQEQLRERLRIARDMHDSLGHRLSLVSVQAAALEVSALPPPLGDTVRGLAGAVRQATDDLYDLVGALRGGRPDAGRDPGLEEVDALVGDFRGAGVPVTLSRSGPARPLSRTAGQAAYRVVQEGLTNAAKHAPGQPVTVRLQWEPDALLVDLVNPLGPGVPEPADRAPAPGALPTGHGLTGLGERLASVGGLVEHGRSGNRWRLAAMLPSGPAAPDEAESALTVPGRPVGLGVAVAVLMFLLLPASLLLGGR